MKKNLRFLKMAAVGLFGAVAFSSCAYDPNYTSVGGSYSTGYGDGYGYGGSSFNTSVFVGTGNPRWGYDPYSYSYYDYSRRAYYDPYLNGYYPVGYRPRAIYGVSHPYGWRPGSGYCRPPGRVTDVRIHNYRNRESAYRNSGYISSDRTYGCPPAHGRYDGRNYPSQANTPQFQKTRPPARPNQEVSGQGRYQPSDTARQLPRYPAQYNAPVAARQPEISGRGRYSSAPQANQYAQRQVRQIAPPDQSRPPRQQPQNPPAASRGSNPNKQKGRVVSGGGRWGGRTVDE